MKKLFTLLFVIGAIEAHGQFAIVGCHGGVHNLNIDHDITATFGSGDNREVCAARNGDKFFVANTTGEKLMFLNSTGDAITDSINVNLRNITALRHSDTLFGLGANNKFYRINTATKVVDSTIIGPAYRLEERPNSQEVWAWRNSSFFVMDINILNGSAYTLSNTFYYNGVIRFNGVGDVAYIMLAVDNIVYKVDANTKTKVDSVTTTASPWGIDVSSDGSRLFIGTYLTQQVYICNTATMDIVDSISVAHMVSGVYRNPNAAEIWVMHGVDNQISIYDETTLDLIDSVIIPTNSPTTVAFSSSSMEVGSSAMTQPERTVFPNPSGSVFNLELPDAEESVLTVSDVSGKVVLRRTLAAHIKYAQVDLSGYSSGIYFLKVADKSRMHFEKLLKY